jgi:hypothetical protein
MFKKRKFKKRIYSISEGIGINNEDSYLLLSDNVIVKYYPKNKFTEEEFKNLSKELINDLTKNH